MEMYYTKLVKLLLLVSLIIIDNPDGTNIHYEFYDFVYFTSIFRISRLLMKHYRVNYSLYIEYVLVLSNECL